MPDIRQVQADLQLREQLIHGLEELNKRLPAPGSSDDIGDIHHPRVPPYFHQKYPRMLHHHKDSHVEVRIVNDAGEESLAGQENFRPEPADQRHFPKKMTRHQPVTVIVHSEEQEQAAIEQGFKIDPPPPAWAAKKKAS